MIIGVPKEIKVHEYRVGLTPTSVRELVSQGHAVLLETNAGHGITCPDSDYEAAGATIVASAADVYAQAEMIVKVKEPQQSEYDLIREDQILFTYLHLAPDPAQAEALIKSGCIAIAYETVTDNQGRLPLLAPMSMVAGRLAVQAGAHCLEKPRGGRGILLGGVPGVRPAKVVVIGGGVVGENAARMAMGLNAEVLVLDKSHAVLQNLDLHFGGRMQTLYATKVALEDAVADADLVIGAVLVAGKAAPKLVTADMLKTMHPGAVLVDVAIDQGGCFATSRPTTHDEPTYMQEGIVHYCVANMPGAVPRTSTFALNNATLPFVLNIANKGYKQALRDDIHLLNGLNICHGQVTCEPVARDLAKTYVESAKAI